MPHKGMMNWQEFPVGSDKPDTDPARLYDKMYGAYQDNDSMKPKVAIVPLPATPSPFQVKK